jgi:hypothetical protein
MVMNMPRRGSKFLKQVRKGFSFSLRLVGTLANKDNFVSDGKDNNR